MSAGMAKPRPCVGTPCGVNAIFAELIPTSFPERSITGTTVTRINRRVGLDEIMVVDVLDGIRALSR